MRRKTEELISLRAALAESESKEAQLKNNVAALGSRVANLDKQLRCATLFWSHPEHTARSAVPCRLTRLNCCPVCSASSLKDIQISSPFIVCRGLVAGGHRKTRTALSKEQELRYKTQAALSSSEKQREEEVSVAFT